MTWTSTADGVLVRTDETFCSNWPDAGRSCPLSGRLASIPPHPHLHHTLEEENTNFRSVNSGTVVLLGPPAKPPALLEAAQRDIGVTVPLTVTDWATAAADLLKSSASEEYSFLSCQELKWKAPKWNLALGKKANERNSQIVKLFL